MGLFSYIYIKKYCDLIFNIYWVAIDTEIKVFTVPRINEVDSIINLSKY